MRILDLFCCDGGASEGYRRAGFEVCGVDIRNRRKYPFPFHQGDALDVLGHLIRGGVVEFTDSHQRSRLLRLSDFDAIHTSPPCQDNSRTKHLRNAQGKSVSELGVNMIPEVRELLIQTGKPYIIENVEGADLRYPILLCGSMFPELHVNDETGRRWLKRHRLFESNVPLTAPACNHRNAGVRPLGVYGSMRDNIPSGGQTVRSIEEGRQLMGIDWMGWSGLKESIPPAYTEFLGQQLVAHIAS